jgi:hypothetical protein
MLFNRNWPVLDTPPQILRDSSRTPYRLLQDSLQTSYKLPKAYLRSIPELVKIAADTLLS